MGMIYVTIKFPVDPDCDEPSTNQLLADIASVTTTTISNSKTSFQLMGDCGSLTLSNIEQAIDKAVELQEYHKNPEPKQRWEAGFLTAEEKREQKRQAGMASGEKRRKDRQPRDIVISRLYFSMTGSHSDKRKQLAKRFNVSERTIRRVVTRTEKN